MRSVPTKGIIDANFAKEEAGIEVTLTSFQQNSERYWAYARRGAIACRSRPKGKQDRESRGCHSMRERNLHRTF